MENKGDRIKRGDVIAETESENDLFKFSLYEVILQKYLGKR